MSTKLPEPIYNFTGSHYFLRNEAPVPVKLDGVSYPTLLHAFLAARFDDKSIRERIQQAETIADARRLVQVNEQHERQGWKLTQMDTFAALLEEKFKDPEMRRKLTGTGSRVLVYRNNHADQFWGVCAGKGYNVLGQMLMGLRVKLQREGQRVEVKPAEVVHLEKDVQP